MLGLLVFSSLCRNRNRQLFCISSSSLVIEMLAVNFCCNYIEVLMKGKRWLYKRFVEKWVFNENSEVKLAEEML